tara:strand:- start:545 stop:1117 length:573 start_codon:yes stop_codon:yes gene_type:complete
MEKLMPDLPQAEEPIILEINETYERCRKVSFEALRLAIKCGELLNEAKEKVPHGDWLNWVETNLTVGHRQAQKLMRVAANRDKILADANSPTYLTIEGALKLLKKKTSISADEKAAIHFTQAALSRDIAAINTNSLVLRLDQALTEICNLDKSAREICSHIPDRSVRAELLTKTERAGAYLDDGQTSLAA